MESKNPGSQQQTYGQPSLGARLDDIVRGQRPDDFVLIGSNGQVWSSYTDKNRVGDVITQASTQFEKQPTG